MFENSYDSSTCRHFFMNVLCLLDESEFEILLAR